MKATTLGVRVPVSIFKEGKTFIAYCPVLDLSTSAGNFGLVKKRFHEAVQIFFEELVDLGTLDEVLGSLGWTKVKQSWNPPLPVAHELTDVSIRLV